MSTDEEPLHSKCPPGSDSWCFYQKAMAKGETPGPHKDNIKTPLRKQVAETMEPTYNRLSNRDLLERCMRGATQNKNESLHHVIWNRCPEEKFLGRKRVQASVAFGACQFNKGMNTTADILKYLGVTVTEKVKQRVRSKDNERLKDTEASALASSREARLRRKLASS